MVKTKHCSYAQPCFHQFEQTVEKQIKAVQQMKLKEMRLAWEIWQQAGNRLREIIQDNEKKTIENISNTASDTQEVIETRKEEIPECQDIPRPQSRSDKPGSVKSSLLDNNSITEPRKSNRARKRPLKYENTMLLTGKNCKQNPSAGISEENSPNRKAKILSPDKLYVAQCTSNDQQESLEIDHKTKASDSQGENQDEVDQVVKELVQNFIAKVRQEHNLGDEENDEELTVINSDLGDITQNNESSPDTSSTKVMANQMKAKQNRCRKVNTNVIKRKRGRTTNLSDDDMIDQGFKRLTAGGFICLTCKKKFPTPSKAQLHARIHSGIRPHMCNKCEKTFLNRHSLHRHELLHLKDLPFACPILGCGKSYIEKRTLDKHIEAKHQNENSNQDQNKEQAESFKCEECGKEMKYKVNLKVHMKLCHEGKRDHQCFVCGKLFQTKGNLIRHQVSHTTERPHGCDKCTQLFKTRDTLQRHMLIHENRPHKCTMCEKAFITNYKLMEHMNSHKKDKVFLCEQCGEAFSHRNTLRSHYQVHFADRKYKCSVCDWAFYTNGDLRRHRLSHSDERPFECQICNKSFARKDSFQKHLRIHGAAAIYRCFYCGQGFWDKLRGKRHVMWCNGGDNNEISNLSTIPPEKATESETENHQQLETIQDGVSTASSLGMTEEASPETTTSSTVLNLTGMNLDIMGIDSGYIIVRRSWQEEDPEGENEAIVIAQPSPALQHIQQALQQEVYNDSTDQMLQMEGMSNHQNLGISHDKPDEAFPQHNLIQGNDGHILTVNEQTEVSPLEQAMRQAGLHRQDILHLQTPDEMQPPTVSSGDRPMLQQSNSDLPLAGPSVLVTPFPVSHPQQKIVKLVNRSGNDLAEALQFTENSNVDDQTGFSFNAMDCFPSEEVSQCSENQDGTDANKNSVADQWFQW